MPKHIAVQLGTLSCQGETEHGSEPYLWPLMICEEGGVPFLRTPGVEFAAKVLVSEMRAGQTVSLPSDMDLLLQHQFNDLAGSLVVLIMAMFEKDSSPQHGSVAVLRHLEDKALAFVGPRLAECRQSSGSRTDLRSAFVATLDLGGAETGALSFLERAVTQVSPGAFDDTLGLDFLTFSGSALTDRQINFNLSRGSDRFTLSAALKVSNVFQALCQRESDAVTQAEAVVKGLQLQRQGLQTQLHNATPQQKPTIIDEIVRISEVELPPAEAALAEAKAALQVCVDRFSGLHTPVLNPINN